MPNLPPAHGLREALAWADQLGGIEDLSALLGDPPGIEEAIDLNIRAWSVRDELYSRNFHGTPNGDAKAAARSALIYAIQRRQLEWREYSPPPEDMELLAEAIDAYLHLANAYVEIQRANVIAINARARLAAKFG